MPAQFLSDTQNRRSDTWGGDLAARARFLRHVVRAIRDATGTGFIVGVRLSPEDPEHGIHLRETAQVGLWLAQDGCDYLHLSLGDASATSTTHPGRHPIDIIREVVPDLPLIGAGGIWTPQQALALFDRGADIVALGRAAILNPDWPRHASRPGWAPTQPPLSPRDYERLGVTAPFLGYLRQQWPELVTSA